jgi:predicted RNA binding protein YcfA (HicA-like mRNA interferase family)
MKSIKQAEEDVKAGFQTARQKGSHLILVKNGYIVPIPKHKEIKEVY